MKTAYFFFFNKDCFHEISNFSTVCSVLITYKHMYVCSVEIADFTFKYQLITKLRETQFQVLIKQLCLKLNSRNIPWGHIYLFDLESSFSSVLEINFLKINLKCQFHGKIGLEITI